MYSTDTGLLGTAQKVLKQVRRVVIGKNNVLTWVYAAILAKGHILMESLPR